jgi:putative radical SAM enzyme (TIGR03279 family)
LSPATISSVSKRGSGYSMGLRPGDTVLSVNGKVPRDVLDYRFLMSGDEATLEIRTASGEEASYEIEKDYDDLLGLEFEEDLFDGMYACANACPFCFVRNLPDGLRASLYVQDDDYRMSFLYGNFVTLTNVNDADITRIKEQRLSPLYVSVHSMDPALRSKMLGNIAASDLGRLLTLLVSDGISFHFQIVVCPGINDGPSFERTLDDLAAFGDATLSIGIVPVGLTRFCKTPNMRTMLPDEASGLLDSLSRWEEENGSGTVFAADELYLMAGRPVPEDSYYCGYPQLENGIGLVRSFLDEATAIKPRRRKETTPKDVLLLTGKSFLPFLADFASKYDRIPGLSVRAAAVRNEFFGDEVTVAGLMAGRDIIEAITVLKHHGLVILPSVCLNHGRFLDGVALDEISGSTGTQVVAVEPNPRALHERIMAS